MGILLMLLAFVSFSCKYGEIKSTTTIGQFNLGVDENEYPVIKKETDEFMRLNKESKITIIPKTTNELMQSLLNDSLKTIIVDRDTTSVESKFLIQNKIELKKHRVAINGCGVIVNSANPLDSLNFDELKKIFTGEIKNWKDLEGNNQNRYKGEIKVFIARQNSALHEFFKSRVFPGSDFSKFAVPCTTSTQMVNEIQNDKMAIGFVSMSWITKFADTLDTLVKPLRIAAIDSTSKVGDYVSLHQAYIALAASSYHGPLIPYPLTFYIYIFSRDFEMNLSVGFMSFLLGHDGQQIILDKGLVPESQPVRIIQLNENTKTTRRNIN